MDAFRFWGIELPTAALEELMTHANFDGNYSEMLYEKASAEGTIQRRVVRILRKHGVLAFEADAIFDHRYALEGHGREGGKVRTKEQARTLMENNPVDPSELVLYTLMLLTDGQKTPLVDEPMAALMAVVARTHQDHASGPAEQSEPLDAIKPEQQASAPTESIDVTESGTDPTSPRPTGGRSSS